MMYDAAAARRIIAGHVSNLYTGLITREAAARNLDALADHCSVCADPEAAMACDNLSAQISAGESPTVTFPKLEISVAPDPDRIPLWDSDTEPVQSEADVDDALQEQERAAAAAGPPAAAPDPALTVEAPGTVDAEGAPAEGAGGAADPTDPAPAPAGESSEEGSAESADPAGGDDPREPGNPEGTA